MIEISYTKTASFDVDAQKGFTPLCPNELPVAGGDKIVVELNRQAECAILRIGSKDVHPPNAIWLADSNNPQLTPVKGDNVDVRWNAHCMSGTYGAELLDGLPKITEYDFFVFKGIEPDLHPYGACYHDFAKKLSTGVLDFLGHSMLRKGHLVKIETVLVGGLALDYCVYETVSELLDAHYQVIINKAATRSIENNFELAVDRIREEFRHKDLYFIESVDELLVLD